MNTYTSIADVLQLRELEGIREKSKNERVPYKYPEEIALIDNLYRLQAIQERQRYLKEQCIEHPFAFLKRTVWNLELDLLSYREQKLLKRNERLFVILEMRSPIPELSVIANNAKERQSASVLYGPIPVHIFKQMELQNLDKELETLYDEKDSIFRLIEQSETGRASTEMNKKLDELIQKEATLLSKTNTIRLDLEADTLKQSKVAIQIPSRETEEKDIFDFDEIPEPAITEQEIQEELDEMQEIREQAEERDFDREEEMER